MAESTVVAISFKDMESNEQVRERAESRCRHLAEEFPEPTHIEVTFAEDGVGFSAHAHATGGTEIAASATAPALPLAADRVLDRLAKALRRNHEKRIFAHRREAMQHSRKRQPRGL
jgi:ribosome-associated translation inhibitor RaiA